MTPALPTLTASDFRLAVIALDTPRHLTPPIYAKRKVLNAAGSHCPLCSQAYDVQDRRGFSHPIIATLIHTFLGGQLIRENLFACCRRCQQHRASADLITLAHVPDDLRVQRDAALMLSTNHLLPLPDSTPLPQFRQAMARRHDMPRFRVYAAQSDDGNCFIGITKRYGDGESKGLAHVLAKVPGEAIFQDERLTVYQLSDADFRQAVWSLIDANAWVVAISRRAIPRDFLDYWFVSSASIGELRRRKVSGLVVPSAPEAKREVGASALRMKRLAERNRCARTRESAVMELRTAEEIVQEIEERTTRQRLAGLPVPYEEAMAAMQRYAKALEHLS